MSQIPPAGRSAVLLALLTALALPAVAQTPKPSAGAATPAAVAADPRFEGAWLGTFKAGDQDAALTIYVAPSDSGGFALTYDFPLQGQVGATSPVTFADNRITITPAPGVSYEGTLSAAGDAITGKLTTPDGEETPLNFARTDATPAPALVAVDDPDGRAGDYTGAISMGAMSLEMTLHLIRTADGYAVTMDVPAQNASGLRATTTTVEGDRLSTTFAFPGEPSYTGTFAADGQTVEGTWTQGGRDLPLVLTRSGD